jgi:hypothetical protein
VSKSEQHAMIHQTTLNQFIVREIAIAFVWSARVLSIVAFIVSVNLVCLFFSASLLVACVVTALGVAVALAGFDCLVCVHPCWEKWQKWRMDARRISHVWATSHLNATSKSQANNKQDPFSLLSTNLVRQQ